MSGSTLGATLRKGICNAFFLSVLATVAMPSHSEGFWSKSYRPDRDLLMDLTNAEARFKEKRDAATVNPTFMVEYVQSGVTISDIACDAWLETLGRSDRDTGFFKDVLNIVGNLILGISGINGANPTSIGRGALGLSAANASIDAFRNEIILGTISDIEDKLKDGRKISAAFFVQNVPANFDETRRKLLEYHDGCSPNAIKVLLRTSLAQVKYVAPDTSLAGPIDLELSNRLSSALYSMMFKPGDAGAVGVLSDESLFGLYVAVIGAPADVSSVFVKNLKSSASVADLKKVFDDKNKNGELGPILQNIADLRRYQKRLADGLAKERSDNAKAEAKAEVEKIEKDLEAAAPAAEDAANALTLGEKKDDEKKAADPVVRDFRSLQPRTLSLPSRLTDSLMDRLRSVQRKAQDHQINFPSDATTAAKQNIDVVADRAQQLKAARERLRALYSTPAAGASPPSISAVLVPVK